MKNKTIYWSFLKRFCNFAIFTIFCNFNQNIFSYNSWGRCLERPYNLRIMNKNDEFWQPSWAGKEKITFTHMLRTFSLVRSVGLQSNAFLEIIHSLLCFFLVTSIVSPLLSSTTRDSYIVGRAQCSTWSIESAETPCFKKQDKSAINLTRIYIFSSLTWSALTFNGAFI